ncbi:MAG: DNA adenine methylase [Candidatus Gracilibacteria bacterium]|jgi:DNA adenine methylase
MNPQSIIELEEFKIASDQMQFFPSTRFMGSKSKLLDFIWDNIKHFNFNSVLDAFSGSGVVGYMFKAKGKKVHSNDILQYSSNIAKALIENNESFLDDNDLITLLGRHVKTNGFIRDTFRDLYFTEEENLFLEQVWHRLKFLDNPTKKAMALSALARACVKKRPRGIFTYTGDRYDDGRKDLRTTLKEHFINAVDVYNKAVFDNDQNNSATCGDIFALEKKDFDLVYMDPPYFSTRSDNDYLRRYHFVEGLASYWQDVEIQTSTKTKKIKKHQTQFDSKNSVYNAFHRLFAMFPKSILVVSYSSNSLPTKEEMIEILGQYKKNVDIKEFDHKYSFGNQNHKIGDNRNSVKEYLFIAY